ncbi:MAG TPA: hypothetical protein VL242_46215 [Sorangium sp.]|uniref:hypothetical protein n=1 Tax=Sorangium sp. So ce1153 TaxID=3133333 RepID=UPI002B70EC2E|nr:hypothetical protein [Sorangium sp.]
MIRSSLVFALLLAGCGGQAPGASQAQPPSQAPASREAGLAAFETVRGVLQHARCQNCHPAGDVPLQGDEGRLHNQYVLRGPTGHGMAGAECTTCHGPTNPPNSFGMNVPPGVAKGWHMPPPEMKMVFVGVAPRALCEQVKDPARNGGKDMAALRVHLEDPLVTWGWNPGAGRTPIPTPYAEFVAAWETWARAGAPCPGG